MAKYGFWWLYFFLIFGITITNYFYETLIIDFTMMFFFLVTAISEAHAQNKLRDPRVDNWLFKQIKTYITYTFTTLAFAATLVGILIKLLPHLISVSFAVTLSCFIITSIYFFRKRVLFWTFRY